MLEWNQGSHLLRGPVDDLHFVKVEHHTSTGATGDILDLVCGSGVGREKLNYKERESILTISLSMYINVFQK